MKDEPHEAHYPHIHPPWLINWFELVTWPLVWWLPYVPVSEGSATGA